MEDFTGINTREGWHHSEEMLREKAIQLAEAMAQRQIICSSTRRNVVGSWNGLVREILPGLLQECCRDLAREGPVRRVALPLGAPAILAPPGATSGAEPGQNWRIRLLPGLLIPRPPQGAAPQEQEEREQTRRPSATRSTMDVAPEGGRFEDEGVTTEENRGSTLATPPQIQGPLELSTPIAEPMQTDEGFAPYDGPDTRVLERRTEGERPSAHQEAVYKRPNDQLTKGDQINLASFRNRIKVEGETQYQDTESGYKIVKDRAGGRSHGGSAWKLLNRSGERIATLSENGTILRR